MKKIKVKIPIYDYEVTYIEVQDKRDKEKVLREMKRLKFSLELINLLKIRS